MTTVIHILMTLLTLGGIADGDIIRPGDVQCGGYGLDGCDEYAEALRFERLLLASDAPIMVSTPAPAPAAAPSGEAIEIVAPPTSEPPAAETVEILPVETLRQWRCIDTVDGFTVEASVGDAGAAAMGGAGAFCVEQGDPAPLPVPGPPPDPDIFDDGEGLSCVVNGEITCEVPDEPGASCVVDGTDITCEGLD